MQFAKKPATKLAVLSAKKGKTFISPNGKEYGFDFEKIGRAYMFILIHDGKRMRVKESDYNNTPIDTLINAMNL